MPLVGCTWLNQFVDRPIRAKIVTTTRCFFCFATDHMPESNNREYITRKRIPSFFPRVRRGTKTKIKKSSKNNITVRLLSSFQNRRSFEFVLWDIVVYWLLY